MRYDGIMKKLIKYSIMVIVLLLACINVPMNNLPMNEIIIIVVIGATTYALLETYCPSVKLYECDHKQN